MILNNNRGMALIVTLAIVSILVVSAVEIGRVLNNSVGYVKHDTDRYKAYQMAMSGINLGQLILSMDAQQNEVDSIQESWADSEKIATTVQMLGYDENALEVKISDELGKVQVNALLKKYPGSEFNEDQRKIWENLFGFIILDDKVIDERDPSEMINSLKDWLDSKDDDSITGISGAESDYYLQLDPSYECANAPINKLSELFLIKGFKQGLFKTEESETKDINDIFTVQGVSQEQSENKGFTFPGKININTADELVIAMLLPTGMEGEASELVKFRTEESDGIYKNHLDKEWYQRVIKLSKKEIKNLERVIRYSSNIFKIDSIAEINNVKINLSVIIERKKMSETGQWTTRIIRLNKG
jgi:general secretion pathway protein K